MKREGPAKAYSYINEVRARAGMPAHADMSQSELRERIRNERRIELAFEDHRFFDVRRWKLYDNVTSTGETGKPRYNQLLNLYGVKVTGSADTPSYTFGLAETGRFTHVCQSQELLLPDTCQRSETGTQSGTESGMGHRKRF